MYISTCLHDGGVKVSDDDLRGRRNDDINSLLVHMGIIIRV